MSTEHHQINYIELPATDLATTKRFYGAVFGWTFQDWGPDYVSFSGGGLDGGFTSQSAVGAGGGALVVLYSDELEASLDAVVAAGGTITRPIFSFPGGRRFHFTDPNGLELAVWGEEVPAA